MQTADPQVRFEQDDSTLTAVEIVRQTRSPLIASLHRALFAIGVVVSSYQVVARGPRLVERIVIERQQGGAVDGALSAEARATILPIVLGADA
jgi:UTP:GlnB (protein PII) uridylyltransferase